jgi:hypothetical protein
MKWLLTTFASTSILTSSFSEAQPANMAGYGLAKCAEIVAMITQDENRTLEVMSWAFGYVSGLNTGFIEAQGKYRNIGAIVENGKVGGFTVPLLRGCRNNPEQAFADMVGQIYAQLPTQEFRKH